LSLPQPENVPNTAFNLPNVFIGNEAFSLLAGFLKPFNLGELATLFFEPSS
jgi:hypothetical protein